MTLTDWPFEFPGAYWLDQREEEAVLDVLRSGSLFRYYGLKPPRHVDAYEAAACEFYGVPYALAVNSGTGALLAAMKALGLGPGQEVILPAFMWVATVGAVVQLNAIPVLCEIDDSFCIDPNDLERKITSRTSLIVPVHMAGTPCDMDAIMRVARDRRIRVLEDCAQCNGGTFQGRKVGTFGDAGIFSLQLNKNMTSGEGGLIITRDERLYRRAFAGHDMGLIRVAGRLAMPEPDAISWGDGRRMSELTGAVAAVQLRKLNNIVDHMRGSNRRIRDKIQNTPGLKLRRLNDPVGDAGAFVIFMLENADHALRVVNDLKAAGLHNAFRIADYGLHIYYNIPSLVNKTPLSPAGNPWNLEANRNSIYTYDSGACPVSDALFARSVLLPVPSRLTPEQEIAAAEIVEKSVAAARV